MANSLPIWKVYCLMAALVIVGAVGAWIAKLQGLQRVDSGDRWEHPWFQAFAMFVGEILCLFYYFIEKYLDKRKYGPRGLHPRIHEARRQGLKTRINVFMFAIPASCDAVATAMIYFAYLNIPLSVAEMMQGALVLMTTCASVIFLGKKFFLYQWGSLVFIVGGIWLVGASSIKNDKGTDGNPVLGVCLMLGALLIQSAQLIVEEKLFRTYYLSPLKVVGFQGLFGICIYLVFLPIAYFIKCGGDLCPAGRLEDSLMALRGLKENYVLLILVIALMIDISVFNTLGNSVTKYASWANRATINTVKVVLVWIFFLIYWGEGQEHFHWLQFGGFILIVIGTFTFNYMKDKQLTQQEEESAASYRPLVAEVNKSDNIISPSTTSDRERFVSI